MLVPMRLVWLFSQEPLDTYLPLQRTSEGGITTQFAKETVEEIGLLKMDFLGLRTLTVINNAVQMVKETQGIEVDFNKNRYRGSTDL